MNGAAQTIDAIREEPKEAQLRTPTGAPNTGPARLRHSFTVHADAAIGAPFLLCHYGGGAELRPADFATSNLQQQIVVAFLCAGVLFCGPCINPSLLRQATD
jgi:hypothetical protein